MSNYTIGVDLGQIHDFSALAVVERLDKSTEAPFAGITINDHHHVRYLHRWELGTPYKQVVAETGDLMRRGQLLDAVVVIDGTGVGREVAWLFKQAYRLGELGRYWPRPFVITGQREVKADTVPKRELIGKMQTLLESGRLKVADGLPLADVLQRELLNFRAKTTPTGHDTYEAVREREHDDIVLAVALACWFRHSMTEPRWLDGEIPREKMSVA